MEGHLIRPGEVSSEDHCLLPMDYNFFADFPHAFHAAFTFRQARPQAAAAQAGAPRRVVLNGTAAWLRSTGQLRADPKIIHFPGVTRKPWQRWSTASRSPWDEEWWHAHSEMCRLSEAPCRITCAHHGRERK